LFSSCSGAIESALSTARGVISVNISLLQNSMKVVHDPAVLSVQSIITTVEGLGYEASEWESHDIQTNAGSPRGDVLERNVQLEISGMTCPLVP
jgi:copper chaperone CopZ